MEAWMDYKTLKKLRTMELNDGMKDNARIIQRCIDYLKGSRQKPTRYMWILMQEIYERHFGKDE